MLLHELDHVLALASEDAGLGRVMLGSLLAGLGRTAPTCSLPPEAHRGSAPLVGAVLVEGHGQRPYAAGWGSGIRPLGRRPQLGEPAGESSSNAE